MASAARRIDAEAYDRKYGDKELVRRIAGYFRPSWQKVVIVCLAIFLMAADP
jgi:hypothetical protein